LKKYNILFKRSHKNGLSDYPNTLSVVLDQTQLLFLNIRIKRHPLKGELKILFKKEKFRILKD